MKSGQLLQAEAQLIGFAHASRGYSIKALAGAMGLTKNEWVKLRNNVFLKESDKVDLDQKFYLNK